MGTQGHLVVWSEGGRSLKLLSLPRLVPASLLRKCLFFLGVPSHCPRAPVHWAAAAGGDPEPTGLWRPCPGRFPVWERPQVGKLRLGGAGSPQEGGEGCDLALWERAAEMAVGKAGLASPLWASVSSPITLGPTRDLPAPTGWCPGSSGRLEGLRAKATQLPGWQGKEDANREGPQGPGLTP